MDLRKMLFSVLAIFALLLASGNARTLEKRSPQEETEAADPCEGSAWTLFYAFGNWCETGEVGAKDPALAEEA